MRRLIIPVLALVVLLSGLPLAAAQHYLSYTDDNGLLIEPVLLTDPFLQMPTEDSVNVVWFTEFDTGRNVVLLQDGSEIAADTFKMSRIREDNGSWIFREEERSALFDAPTMRNIWRHEATVGDLEPGERVGYSVMSVFPGGEDVTSETFTLAPLPEAGQPLNILLTSDHQNMPMVAANLQMVEAVYGTGGIDAVLLAGDLVNIPDRAGEWFDYGDGGGFFKSLQGNSERDVEWYGGANTFTGGEIIQHAPLFPATGNHEVMGRYHPATPGLNEQYNRPRPVAATEALYEANRAIINPDDDPAVRERFIEDNSFNTITYEEIFSLPDDSPGGETYYSVQFGDVYLISLYATRIWRTPNMSPDALSKYSEPEFDLANPGNWGFGSFIFEPISEGSEQYNWLAEQLESAAFQNARYKVVMLHHPIHSLGGNVVPAFTDPVPAYDYDEDGNLVRVRYEYPLEDSYLTRDVEPLLQAAGVDLVLNGHNHVYNHFRDESGVVYLETSNVGNSYGAYTDAETDARTSTPPFADLFTEEYVAAGDPSGLEPVLPGVMPLTDADGNPLAWVESNKLTVFSVLETETGTIRSYYYDTTLDPEEAEIVLFDEFSIGG